MARIKNVKDAMERHSGGNGGFFSLKNDGDMATVRFPYKSKDEFMMDIFEVHEVSVDGSKRYASCLKDDEGTECSGCEISKYNQLKVFIQLFNYETQEMQIWERGKTFIPEIMDLLDEYDDLSQYDFKVKRNGKAGDAKTKYTINLVAKSDKNPLPEGLEWKDLLGTKESGGFVLELTDEELAEVVVVKDKNGATGFNVAKKTDSPKRSSF